MSLVARLTERVRTVVDGGRAAALPVPPVGFTDGTIALRPWRPSDGLDLAALCDDEAIRRWTSVPPQYKASDAAGNAAWAETQRREGRGVHLAITDARDAVLLGAADLTVAGADRRTARVSFLLRAGSRGAGHATRAVRLLDGWAFRTVGVDVLEIRPQAGNEEAIAVARRAGVNAAPGGDAPDAEGRITFARRAGDPVPEIAQG
jgi:RimJ/RimL family protein N-acetyltransferase